MRISGPILGFVFISCCTAATPQFSTYLGGKWGEYAAAVTTDRLGNIYVAGQTGSSDFPVSAGAAQTSFGGGSDAFVAKFAPSGTLLWCSFFGGSGSDGARGIGVDRDGNVIIAGQTDSQDLPVVNAISTRLDNGHLRYGVDPFVAKFDASGGRLLYATYLGGSGNDWANALAVDADGNAFITGDVGPADCFPGPGGANLSSPSVYTQAFVVKLDAAGAVIYTRFLPSLSPRGIALDSAGAVYLTGGGSVGTYVNSGISAQNVQAGDVVVVKLAPDGSGPVYASTFGGALFDIATAIAVDGSGSAYVTGMTNSADFPSVNPIQRSFGARTLWKTVDRGANWFPVDDPPFGALSALATVRGKLYAAAIDGGVFVSSDGGATWPAANLGLDDTQVQTLVADPSDSTVFYAGTRTKGVYKTTDGARTWTHASNGLSLASTYLLAVDPSHPATIYAVNEGGAVAKTTDGGDTWTPAASLNTGCGNCLTALQVDSRGTVYAASIPANFKGFHGGGTFRSTDGGASWQAIDAAFAVVPNIVVDSSTIYAGVAAVSTDGGVTFVPTHGPTDNVNAASAVAIDPTSGTLYAATRFPDVNLYVSADHGATWQTAPSTPVSGPPGAVPQINAIVPDPDNPGTIYAIITNTQSSAFVSKLSPDGSSLLFSTFLNGHPSMDPNQTTGGGIIYPTTYVSPGPTYATGLALDATGNVTVTGTTRSNDFPTTGALQPQSGGIMDTFVTTLSADGAALLYSTYLGGGYNDGSRAVAIDPDGNIIVAGQTYSGDFPIVNAVQSVKGNYDEAFVVKFSAPASSRSPVRTAPRTSAPRRVPSR